MLGCSVALCLAVPHHSLYLILLHGLQLFLASQLEEGDLTEDLSNHMGLFLQKTNIIRDYLEDIVEEPAPRCHPCSALPARVYVVLTAIRRSEASISRPVFQLVVQLHAQQGQRKGIFLRPEVHPFFARWQLLNHAILGRVQQRACSTSNPPTFRKGGLSCWCCNLMAL